MLLRAKAILPSDPQIQSIEDEATELISLKSDPAGATVAIQDFFTPGGAWKTLGTTPMTGVRVPKGYFRWKVTGQESKEMLVARSAGEELNFPLCEQDKAPTGMVYVPPDTWRNFVGFVGWQGPYKLPAFYVDKFEVTNREFQHFVDDGGYTTERYWPRQVSANGTIVRWEDSMAKFRDTTDRPGPSTWVGGHYLENKGDYPVSGVSWFEASAYAAYAGKSLPTLAQWFEFAPADNTTTLIAQSNIKRDALAPVGAYKGLGPLGTYDTAGNVREWVGNADDQNLRFILGGSWKSPAYLYSSPEAESPFDRSDGNGVRCVRNIASVPEAASQPIHRVSRDFSRYKPADDAVFQAYQAIYAYPEVPLRAISDGIVRETADWREEKVSFNTAYRGERMKAYLFLPKRVHPPFQTVLFFPSARVEMLPNSAGGELGDLNFFDYLLESGRAVMYPIYQDTYERRVKFEMPSGAQDIELTSDRYKDAARSLDYLATRPDIDSSRLAYLGVSMGAAEGVIATELLQNRLKTAVFLDGGYFLDPAPPGGDLADFAPRMKKPVLMVNGRYDYVFSVEKAQDPLFAMLGTRAIDKRHVLLDTPHDVTQDRPNLVRTVLEWLDHYLGRVD